MKTIPIDSWQDSEERKCQRNLDATIALIHALDRNIEDLQVRAAFHRSLVPKLEAALHEAIAVNKLIRAHEPNTQSRLS